MLRPVLFKLDRFPGNAGGSTPSILNQGHLIDGAVPGAVLDDEDGSSWAFLQQATLAVALAATIATTAHAAQANDLANAWQDELPPQGYGWTAPASLDLWSQSTGRPRFVSFGSDEVIVLQPARDDGSDAALTFVVPARVNLSVAQDDDGIVPQTISVDEIYWQAPDPARTVLAFPPPVLDDDLPIAALANYGSTGGTAPDLWSASTGRPRIIQLYADEGIVAQPLPLHVDEDYWQAPTVVPTVVRAPIPALDTPEIVAQPSGTALDDGDYQPALQAVPPASVWMPVPWQFGGESGSVWGPIDEDYEVALTPPRRALPCLADSYSDETIVPQAVPLHVDELYWETPPSFATVVRGTVVVSDNPEIVPQPLPFRLEEGTWDPPFSTAPARWLHVSQWQDELVPTIHIDEHAPDPWLLLPIPRVIVLPSPDEYDFALGGMDSGYPQPGINHIVFDASITVAVFDSLVTRIVTDSLITRSVFDG